MPVFLRTFMLATLISVAVCVAAQAQSVTLGQFQHPKTAKDLETNKAYLLGAIDALLAADAGRDDRQFCLPGPYPKLSFEQAGDLIMRWARKTSGSADLPVGRVLLYSLREAYPCRH